MMTTPRAATQVLASRIERRRSGLESRMGRRPGLLLADRGAGAQADGVGQQHERAHEGEDAAHGQAGSGAVVLP